LPNGRYDITFHFAEHAPIGGGERVFDVLVEDRVVIPALDVMRSRDGKVDSALTVTIPGLEITDGQLDIRFSASVGQPVLSALVVRPANVPSNKGVLIWADEFGQDGGPDPEKWSIDEWPAAWMLPSDPFRYATTCSEGDTWQGSETCDAWPNSGEMDFLEHVGYEMGHVHGTVHNRAYYWINWEQRKGRILLDEVDQQWHTYAMEWSPDRVDIFVDDTLYFTYVNENDGWKSWPYDHPFHLILNIAVGGVWGRAGGGIDDGIFPQRMLVDYVRVYRLEP